MIPAMSDRGLPIVDGAPACPFVAFEDDRDGRSTAPDHRHRCFAEPRPAPRALAHQEAYCLASAFPVCPTFQDWARREAAAARPGAPTGRPADEPQSQPMPPLERDDDHAGSDELTPAPSRRPQRDWAAPPPWAGAAAAGAAGAAAGGAGAGAAGAAAASSASPIDDTPPEARGLAGSAADRLAGPDPADPLSSAPPSRATQPPDRYAPPASAMDDLDDEVRDDAPPAAAAAVGGAWAASTLADLDDDEPDWASRQHEVPPAEPRAAASRPPVRDDTRPPAPNPHDQVSRRQAQDPNELFGPAWERPHRYEAYPSLRTRVGLPGMSGVGRVGIAALALFVAALALFFVGPMLLGIGNDNSGGGAGATSTPIAEETASPEPTPVPEPTPTVYVVKKGDTISKIANKYDLTVKQLLAANAQIKNPNQISIGDEVIIPVPTSEEESS